MQLLAAPHFPTDIVAIVLRRDYRDKGEFFTLTRGQLALGLCGVRADAIVWLDGEIDAETREAFMPALFSSRPL